ncbi:ABC transporter ATP-binding protein [Sulfurisphaera ohwakuensis]|uniref:ATP-binding cassette domain-containing protein n=1 Tax=Sulfurisphaera ohwakuensis TaxID=69656 RepID=A0A650CDQ7_SULOH|nr:ABC transporter ATP-binding protein [Sulfurisphaera ohwakuensis]MBB5253085.1 putative ABC transport system ATP-binding protein [Sulfurisphaera ohwakuensis]QGR15993.1 ATP-binding cassette domain-containing protein [Sulfurisphaera ohwakuensis]
MKHAVQLIDVSKVYKSGSNEWVALRDVNLNVEEGEFIALVGPSGSGKTTMLNIIGLMDSPTEGHVILEGKDVTYLSEKEKSEFRNKYIGYVFQSYNLISFLTVYQNVELPLIISGISKKEREKIVEEVLNLVPGIYELRNKKPTQLSGGQQQRVAIARALVTKPKLILADEPTANLDVNTGKAIVDLFKKIKDEMGITIVMATHDLEMLKNCDRIVYIRDGKIERIEDKL